MSIEDVADRADVWEASLKRILKAVGAVGAALAGVVAGLMMLWPDGEVEKPKQQFHPLTGANTIQIGERFLLAGIGGMLMFCGLVMLLCLLRG